MLRSESLPVGSEVIYINGGERKIGVTTSQPYSYADKSADWLFGAGMFYVHEVLVKFDGKKKEQAIELEYLERLVRQ
jgi:hypothetical protein